MSVRVPAGLALLASVLALSGACNSKGESARRPPKPVAEAAVAEKPLFDLKPAPKSPSKSSLPKGAACSHFVDVAGQRRLAFTYQNGERGQSLMVETTGGGCGCLDYDADGLWDFYFCQGGEPAATTLEGQPNDSLLRQEADGGFVEVAALAHISERGYGQGVAIGDFDNDGFDDFYVTNVGKNTLWKNQGDGTFQEVTEEAGVGDERWSSSAAFADLDLDGDLDLYVCNYTDYDPHHPKDCRDATGRPRICHPKDVEPSPDECYFNLGDGRFRPEAKERGLFGPGNKALGVAVADFNNDRLPDLYIANDTTANFLFLNRGQARFDEKALELGCAADRNGQFQASMGLAIGDYDRNGYLDIYSTHFYDESNTLYKNLGQAGFEDVTGFEGLHEPTLLRLGFGTSMQDFNQDGWQELFVTNGHVENFPGNPLHKMRPQIFSYEGSRWRECTEEAGDYFQHKYVGRGVAHCDYDEDGDPDLVVVPQNTPTALLQNDSQRGHWLKMLFRGRQSNRRGIGCRVTVHAQGEPLFGELFGGGSYCCSHQPALFFGLGEFARECKVAIDWPSGVSQTLDNVAVDQTLVIDEPVEASASSALKGPDK